jgi:hypothetical protein
MLLIVIGSGFGGFVRFWKRRHTVIRVSMSMAEIFLLVILLGGTALGSLQILTVLMKMIRFT